MLELPIRDNDGVLNRYGDMIEIGLELKCDEETQRDSRPVAALRGIDQWWTLHGRSLHNGDGYKHLKSLFIGSSQTMKTFEPEPWVSSSWAIPRYRIVPARLSLGKVILVVDEIRWVIASMRDILNELGYVVESAMEWRLWIGQGHGNKAHPLFFSMCHARL